MINENLMLTLQAMGLNNEKLRLTLQAIQQRDERMNREELAVAVQAMYEGSLTAGFGSVLQKLKDAGYVRDVAAGGDNEGPPMLELTDLGEHSLATTGFGSTLQKLKDGGYICEIEAEDDDKPPMFCLTNRAFLS